MLSLSRAPVTSFGDEVRERDFPFRVFFDITEFRDIGVELNFGDEVMFVGYAVEVFEKFGAGWIELFGDVIGGERE
jgi:hypothetical protein